MAGKALRRGRSATARDTDASASAPASDPPPAAPDPSLTASTHTDIHPGASVSTDSDSSSFALVTAGSTHSRRATTNTDDAGNNIINNNNISSPTVDTPQRSGAIDFSTHPEFDLSDDAEVHSHNSGGVDDTTNAPLPDLNAIIERMELLTTQTTKLQLQLVNQLEFNRGVSTSISSVKSDIQLLRDASTTSHDILSRTGTIADEAQLGVLRCTTDISLLTSKLNAVQSTISELVGSRSSVIPPPTCSDAPPAGAKGIEDAFAAAEAAISNGISEMETEVGSSLDRKISAHTPARNPLFNNVDDRWSDREPHDSEAAYAAARARNNDPSSPSTTDTSNKEYSVRVQESSPMSTQHRTGSTGSYGDGLSPRYNGPSSPRHRLALTRNLAPEILAWHAGTPSGGDPVLGTDFMEAEDVEALGIPADLASNIAENHYDIETHWNNPRWMQRDERDFSAKEYGYHAPSTGGPDITNILKQVASWDKLSDLTPTGWHAFYNKLRRFCFKWKIALMPFGAINLKYQCFGHALCTCGLGLERYKLMGDALFSLLEYLLPMSNPIIASTLDTLAINSSSANGYTLLWTLLREFIPMLDCTTPTQLPTWPESNDIFQFARLVIMYCDLAQHRGPQYSDAMKSRLFLSTVRGRYASMANQFTALVGTYCPGRDGSVHCSDPLPRHLSVLELARTFYDEANRVDVAVPTSFVPSIHAHQTMTTPTLPSTINEVTPTSLRTPTSSLTHATDNPSASRPDHIQGFTVNTTRTSSPSRRRSAPNPTARQSRNQTTPRYQSACEACGKYGHPANRCDMLAMALFIQRYARDRSNAEVIKALEAQWVERNKPFLPRDDRMPRTILANYCAEFEFSEDMVDTEMDWDFLTEPNASEDGME